jgi:cation transport ATPase
MNQRANGTAMVHITTLRVTGIRCGACAIDVAEVVADIRGVVHVDVRQQQSEIVVEHLPAFVEAAVIAASIRRFGYGAEVQTTIPDAVSDEATPSSCRCCKGAEENRSWLNLGTSTIG